MPGRSLSTIHKRTYYLTPSLLYEQRKFFKYFESPKTFHPHETEEFLYCCCKLFVGKSVHQ